MTTPTTPAGDKLIAAIEANPGSTTAELVEIAGVARSTASVQLRKLAEQGLIAKLGVGPKGADTWAAVQAPTLDTEPADDVPVTDIHADEQDTADADPASERPDPRTDPRTNDEARKTIAEVDVTTVPAEVRAALMEQQSGTIPTPAPAVRDAMLAAGLIGDTARRGRTEVTDRGKAVRAAIITAERDQSGGFDDDTAAVEPPAPHTRDASEDLDTRSADHTEDAPKPGKNTTGGGTPAAIDPATLTALADGLDLTTDTGRDKLRTRVTAATRGLNSRSLRAAAHALGATDAGRNRTDARNAIAAAIHTQTAA